MNNRKLETEWEEIKQKIRQEYDLSIYAYDEWIEPLVIDKYEKSVVIIGVPEKGEYTLKYYYQKYRDSFQRLLSEYLGRSVRIEFEYTEDTQNIKRHPVDKENTRKADFLGDHLTLDLHIRKRRWSKQINDIPLAAMNQNYDVYHIKEAPKITINIYFD